MSNNYIPIIVVMLAIIVEALNPVAARHVLELRCSDGGLSFFEHSCTGTSSPSYELKIQVNTQTQKVRFVGYELNGSRTFDALHNCDVIDGDNWDCKAGDELQAMRDGHYLLYASCLGVF
jgi:hypothetical protein